VRFEGFDLSAQDCLNIGSMSLTLLDASGATLLSDLSSSGIGVCPALSVNLAPGTYYIQAAAKSGTVAAYALDIRYSTDDGTEAEPNDTQAQANPEAGTELFVCGDHQNPADVDVYAVTVPAGKSLRAEVVEVAATAPGYVACSTSATNLDSFLTLYDPTFTAIASDDDSGRGDCSQIDGTGTSPAQSGAHHLAAGTYYLAVQKSPLATPTGAVFDYCLAVTLR
jgi:hypothetical protein